MPFETQLKHHTLKLNSLTSADLSISRNIATKFYSGPQQTRWRVLRAALFVWRTLHISFILEAILRGFIPTFIYPLKSLGLVQCPNSNSAKMQRNGSGMCSLKPTGTFLSSCRMICSSTITARLSERTCRVQSLRFQTKVKVWNKMFTGTPSFLKWFTQYLVLKWSLSFSYRGESRHWPSSQPWPSALLALPPR